MSDPQKLVVANAAIKPRLVEVLEEALAQARKGELTGFVLVGMKPGHWYWAQSSFDNRLELAGALAFATKDVLEVGN